MNKFAIVFAAVAISASAGAAQAGGWGKSGNNNYSSGGLINVAPSVALGDIKLLNGNSILSGSPILSGNVVSGILSGNNTGNGLLNGLGLGVLGSGNNNYSIKKRH